MCGLDSHGCSTTLTGRNAYKTISSVIRIVFLNHYLSPSSKGKPPMRGEVLSLRWLWGLLLRVVSLSPCKIRSRDAAILFCDFQFGFIQSKFWYFHFAICGFERERTESPHLWSGGLREAEQESSSRAVFMDASKLIGNSGWQFNWIFLARPKLGDRPSHSKH